MEADAQEMMIRSEHASVGEINIHFPGAGFDVTVDRKLLSRVPAPLLHRKCAWKKR